jgi:hypothetical protein
MVHIYLSIHNLGIVPGENLTLPTKEQDCGSLWHPTDSLHNDKLHDSYISPNVIRVKKNSTRMRLSGYVARVGEGRGEVCTEFWWGNLRGRELLEDLDLDGRTILKPTLNGMGEFGMD